MSSELHAAPRRRPLGFELAIVVLVALGVNVPGIWSYSLVDPWETHYGEVSRRMLADHDWVHTDWQDEGFRSKPVLTFWIEAISMRALHLAHDGGYSGELEDAGGRTMIAIRLPFVLFGVLGLALMWWMLARLVNRRLAWLALLVVGSCPMYCLIARQAIPDMPLVACMTGALAMFAMAMEDGDRAIEPFARIGGVRGVRIDARHVLWLVAGGIVVVQALYYAYYFARSPHLAANVRWPLPAVTLPAIMLLMLGAMSRDGWLVLRLPFVLLGGAICELRRGPVPQRARDQTTWSYIFDGVLATWERDAVDRYIVRAIVYPIPWVNGGSWRETDAIADRLLGMAPIATMRQVFMLWCYALLGVSVLAKGPPALGIVGIVGVFYVVLLGRWRALYAGAFELKRGVLLATVVCIPWHVAMYLKDGPRFFTEYVGEHLLNRASVGVDNSPGTFEHYLLQLGYGMWMWAALLPAAIVWLVLRTRTDTRDGRVRFVVALWAIVTIAFFSIVQTKFHHYILPAVPALGIAIAFFLDDSLAGRVRLHPLLAAIGVAIVLFVCRDLMAEPQKWIEMFVFRYDRPWPAGEPWHVDPSDGFLALGVIAAGAIALLGTRLVRVGTAAVGAAGLAICVWSLQAYMPVAGTHWGMRDAMRTYYAQRTIYGETLVYFGSGELYDAWHDRGDRWRVETFVPDAMTIGQPMTLHVEVQRADIDIQREATQDLVGRVTAIGDHDVEVTLVPGERAKLEPLLANAADGPRGRAPYTAIDGDRLLAWQLYWRGENFWSADEIFGWLPEQKTAFVKTDNVDFLKYLGDSTRAPLGRRYFLITEASRATGVRSLLPTQRARDTFELVDTTSNKFTMVSFWL